MADETERVDAVDRQIETLNYAGPRVCRRYQRGAFWKAVVRVTAGMMLFSFAISWILSAFRMPLEALLSFVALGAVVALAVLITWERGFVLREDVWDDAKDRRATTWRPSASRFDSSGVTILDPHAMGKKD